LENGASTEHATVGAATETRKAEAKHSQPHRASTQARASARTQVRRGEQGRQTADDEEPGVPSWAIRGAEVARRESGREERARAPSWAIRGAESAARAADHDAQPRETFGSSWQSEPAWHFRWQ
jgi:hypothetical protein